MYTQYNTIFTHPSYYKIQWSVKPSLPVHVLPVSPLHRYMDIAHLIPIDLLVLCGGKPGKPHQFHHLNFFRTLSSKILLGENWSRGRSRLPSRPSCSSSARPSPFSFPLSRPVSLPPSLPLSAVVSFPPPPATEVNINWLPRPGLG